MKKRVLLIILCIFLTVGCADQEIIDEVQIVNSYGLDLEDDTKIRGTILYPIFKYGQTEEPSIIATTADTIFDIPLQLNNKSSLPIAFGQLRSLIIGESLSEKGLDDIINTIARNPDLGRTLQMAIVKGNAHEMLSSVTKKKISDSQFVSNLIEQNIKTENLPRINFQVFLFSFFSDDRDAFLPMLKQEKDAIKLTGLALFDKDKVVGTINMSETFLFKLLSSGSKHGRYSMHIKDDNKKGEVTLQNIRTKTNYDLHHKDDKPSITIHLKIDGLVKEYPGWINLTDPKNVTMVEDKLKEDIEKQGKKLLEKFQKMNIDPICFTDYIRSRTRGFDSKKFKEIYSDVEFTIKAEIQLVQTGINE
ncbi:Ger(x)C family spore germination protein [Metabacillus iocasae]|uniref:Ger(X)C family germination protein n=1 Tax=Priestia iocasae TaxID=2291674 RepID=A0ABS2QS12_9BACI|nr:Ger(x)C family spore germination protein [Metabacillus iocasae]MBM7702227.1 Ger(x)C family germination protein [Metabacillus iocasae]